MARLIVCRNCTESDCTYCNINILANALERGCFNSLMGEQHTVQIDSELVPVRHGHWIKRSKVYPGLPYDHTYHYECSNCGYMDTAGEDVEVPYCWHCGAKMDESKEQSKGETKERRENVEGHCSSEKGAKMHKTKDEVTDDYEEPEINPCRGCEDYDGKGGCISKGGCGERRET